MTDGSRLCIVHAGDSRAYLFSEDALSRLTKDHSVVQTLVDKGFITEEQAAHHVYKNLITRALGTEPGIEVDYTELPFGRGDVVLLCTDGLTNYLQAAEIAGMIAGNRFEDTADSLVNAANLSGGGDNITAVLLRND